MILDIQALQPNQPLMYSILRSMSTYKTPVMNIKAIPILFCRGRCKEKTAGMGIILHERQGGVSKVESLQHNSNAYR